MTQPEPDATCECGHVFDEHEKNGRGPCTIDDCRCLMFEEHFLEMMLASLRAPTLSFPQEDGRLIQVLPMTYGNYRLTIGPSDIGVYDDGW